MVKITKTGVLYSLMIVLFLLMQIFINQYSIETEINEDIMDIESFEGELKIKNTSKDEIWQIEIPKISLIVHIEEGITKETLNNSVGHFENTSKKEGNIGLAFKYLKQLKLLKEGDEIKYKNNNFEKIYEIEKCRIIKDTEWKFLEETEENRLTLITYVENEPQYRRCIQAVEK